MCTMKKVLHRLFFAFIHQRNGLFVSWFCQREVCEFDAYISSYLYIKEVADEVEGCGQQRESVE